MAKNIQNVRFLRNGNLFTTHDAAYSALSGYTLTDTQDGTIILARYGSGTEVKTLAGLVYFASNDSKSITIIDVEGASGDVETLREEINAKLGDGITSDNTASAQLAALSGNNESTSAETSVEGAKKYADAKIGELDYTGVTTGDAVVVTNVTETDGIVSASTANVGGLKLTDYTLGSDSGAVAATDSINEAFSKVEKQIANVNDVIGALDTNTVSGDSKVVIDVTQTDGKITATAGNLTGVKLDGYAEASSVANIATTDTLGEALGKLQKTIHDMDKTASAEDGKVVTTVSEADGVVSETKANVKDLQLGGYAKTNDTGDIASGDTINVALSKLENKAAAITIANADGSINVTTATTGTDINVNIKSGEHVLAKDGNAGLYTNISLSSITPSSTTIKEEYQLTATDGTVLGDTIKIYKDSSLYNVYLGHMDDTIAGDPPVVTSGTGDTALCFIYHKEDGSYKLVPVNVESFLEESEFASGVTANADHVVHGVVDSASEKDESNVAFLTVGADGFKISGIKDAIDTKINKLDAVVTGGTTAGTATSNHIQVVVGEADGKLTGVTVTETNIADADGLAALSAKTITEVESSNSSISATTAATTTDGTVKVDVVTDASKIKMTGFTAAESGFTAITSANTVTEAVKAIETEILANEEVVSNALNDLNAKIASGVASATTEVVEGSDAGNNLSISSGAAADGHTIYTINLSDVASATALAVLDGDVIKGVKVNGSALTETNNEVNIQISSSAVTGTDASPIVVNTGNDGAVTLTFQDLDAGTY